LKRYGGTKLERARDLFQRCIDACPPDDCIEFFLLDGKFEEEHGLTKRALGVYRQMCTKVSADDKYTAYQLYIAKTAKILGQTATRDIYQSAIQNLDDDSASRLCLDFADMETSLQEIERARAVLVYGAQMADPRRNEEYWNKWNEFEIANGNEETFREMLRIKRSVEAAFSTVNYNAAEMSGAATKQAETLSNDEALRMIAEREGVQLDQTSTTISGFVRASGSGAGKRSAQAASLDEVEERVAKLRKATAKKNQSIQNEIDGDDDEIDIEDELDAEEKADEATNDNKDGRATIKNVCTKEVPDAVFGGLKA
jgi:pre-mRNA-splicing factor SYF1